MNLATMTAAPTLVDVGGRTLKVGPLRYRDLGLIQRYLDDRHRESGAAGESPPVGQDQRWVDALLGHVEGVVFFLNVLFSGHQPFTGDDLAHVMAHVGPRQLRPLFLVAMEESPDPDPAGGEGGGPKKGGAAPSTT